ncbi:MAG: RNA 2',3'-cyclic phosphodiesterase [Nitrososphaerota archaeon]|nr:RNA 2',3'-cyclic phosphodiesterase [Candidatus Bathyarchaeota archaeon]MCX8162613.1 RNA 2',3'-cyclic phosphodiesterase [Candidatus Bathyarchaeota archaeon]MDW8061511.1 RNA 2',3'-cyclic phosphodiesterase [Nitrososphaerota archaeon]
MSESYRCFVAVDLEDGGIVEKVKSFQEALARTGNPMKLVEPENLHFTLKFLDEVPLAKIESIRKALSSISFKPFDVEVKGVGYFPGGGRVNVVWVGVGRGYEELKDIYEKVEAKLSGLGFARDPRGFTAHLTVSRVKSIHDRAKLFELIDRWRGYTFGEYRVDRVKLKRSVLTPRGPVYSDLHVVEASR